MLMLVTLVLLLTTAGAASGQTLADQELGLSTFNIFFGSTLAGIERVTLNRSAAGWTITSSGQLSPPIELLNRNLEIEYDDNWEPRQLVMDGRRQNEDFLVRTSFSDGFATNSITDGSTTEELEEPVSANSIILPDYFFGAQASFAAFRCAALSGCGPPLFLVVVGSFHVQPRAVQPGVAVVGSFLLCSPAWLLCAAFCCAARRGCLGLAAGDGR